MIFRLFLQFIFYLTMNYTDKEIEELKEENEDLRNELEEAKKTIETMTENAEDILSHANDVEYYLKHVFESVEAII